LKLHLVLEAAWPGGMCCADYTRCHAALLATAAASVLTTVPATNVQPRMQKCPPLVLLPLLLPQLLLLLPLTDCSTSVMNRGCSDILPKSAAMGLNAAVMLSAFNACKGTHHISKKEQMTLMAERGSC
jgi:hypothetical protein